MDIRNKQHAKHGWSFYFFSQSLSYLPFNGKVDLKRAQHTFYVMEDYGDCPKTAPEDPLRVFFGRQIGCGQRDLINRFSIKKRHFIGGTSMDAHLAFLMANQAKVCVHEIKSYHQPFMGY